MLLKEGTWHVAACAALGAGGHARTGCEKWLSARRGGTRLWLMSHGEPVKSELFCVKKRWPKKEASRPEVLLSVNANLVSLLSGAVSVRGPNRAKIEGWT